VGARRHEERDCDGAADEPGGAAVKTTLKFNEKAHRYWLDGKPIPGVTTLIKGGLPAPQLTYWAARTVAEYVADNDAAVEALRGMGRASMVAALKETPWTARDKAGVRGTEVHALAERLVAGESVDVPEHLAGHVESYVDFLDTIQPRPVLVEACVLHRKNWYAGRLDLVADLPERIAAQYPQLGPRPLLDVKTASGIYPETAFQLAAYRYADAYVDSDGIEQPMETLGITGAAAIHVRADGWDVVPVRADDYVYRRFLHIAFVSRCTKEMKEYVAPPLARPTDEDTAA
jgi:hypothetical protein